MNPFSKIYNGLSSADLIRIIDNPGDYQPLAVEAAKAELASRQLPDHEIMELRIDIKNAQEEKAVKRKLYEDKIQGSISSVVDIVNPIAPKGSSTERVIAITSILFGLFSAYQIYREFGFVKFMISDERAKWGPYMIIYLILPIIPLTGSILFWFRKKAGWMLLMIYLVYLLHVVFEFFIIVIRRQSWFGGTGKVFDMPVSFIIAFFIEIVFGFILLRKDIRSVFSVNKKSLIVAAALSIVWAIIVDISQSRY